MRRSRGLQTGCQGLWPSSSPKVLVLTQVPVSRHCRCIRSLTEFDMSAGLPTISIVTPSYNQGQFLQEALESVLASRYPHVELVVVDGGSSDDSPDIVRRYAPRLAWWVSEKDGGQYDAINKGFAHTTGEVMAWL